MTSDTIERRTRALLLDSQRRVLERITSGAPLKEVLETLVRLIEEQADGMLCAVLLADPLQQRLAFVAAPSIPEDYKSGIAPYLRIAPNMGSCGTAAFLRKPVYTDDTATDSLWEKCRGPAVRNGLRAIWSTPILSDDNSLLGTFAMYYSKPGLPSSDHIQLIDMATQMARVAIEAKRAEDALRQSEDRLHLVIETIPAMVWTALPDGSVDFANGRWLEYIGMSMNEFQTRGWASLLEPDDLARSREYWETTVAAGQPAQIEHRVRRADGQYRWLVARGVPLRDELGQIIKWYGTATDIDNQKRAEETLRQSAEELQALSRRLVDLQEAERKELARELHDRVGQSLTALNINLAILRKALSQHGAHITSRLEDSTLLLESTVQAIENVASDLRPPMLDDHGLRLALDWYAKQFSARAGIAVSVRASEPDERIAADLEITLFRIAQEALNNVARHARAKSVVIALHRQGPEYGMSVADDGVGLRVEQARADRPSPGLGIVTMRERAQAVGGRFRIESLPGGGTRLTVRIPKR